MAGNPKTGFSPCESSNSPGKTDTTSGSHAPPVSAVKVRRADSGRTPSGYEARCAPRASVGVTPHPAAPATKTRPEVFDLTGKDDLLSVKSSATGKTVSVDSSTATLIAAKMVAQQKRVAAESEAAAKFAAAAAEAAKLEEVTIDAMIAATSSRRSASSVAATEEEGDGSTAKVVDPMCYDQHMVRDNVQRLTDSLLFPNAGSQEIGGFTPPLLPHYTPASQQWFSTVITVCFW